MNHSPQLPTTDTPSAPRFTVELPLIDPTLPQLCVRCLSDTPEHLRPMTFRRADKTVERVVAVQWPYCTSCYQILKPLDKATRAQGGTILAQMLLVAYAVGAAMGYYKFWYPTLALLLAMIPLYVRLAKNTRSLWGLEWAAVVDVYKDGLGSRFSFRSRRYADLFAAANQPATDDVATETRSSQTAATPAR